MKNIQNNGVIFNHFLKQRQWRNGLERLVTLTLNAERFAVELSLPL